MSKKRAALYVKMRERNSSVHNVDRVFTALVLKTYSSKATLDSKKWLTTKYLASILPGLTTIQIAQSTYLLRQEGSIASRPSNTGSMYEHTALYATRKKKRMGRIGTPRKSMASTTKTTTIVPPPTDALEALLNATASIERELKDLRKFKDKVTSILGE